MQRELDELQSAAARFTGYCSSRRRAAGPRLVLATAIGEESFTDTNGNGSFDNGEVFADLPERFLDENENDVRDGFEPIYDFNNNSTYDPVDGDFNGVLCLDNTGRCSANTTTGISASNHDRHVGQLTDERVAHQRNRSAGDAR